MLAKLILIVCLSVAAGFAGGNTLASTSHTNATEQADEEALSVEGDLDNGSMSDRQMQLAFFAGLTVVFVVMVSLLFRKYKGKRSIYRQKYPDDIFSSDGASFSPIFFSSDSSPAIVVAEHNNDLRLFITNTLRLNYRVVSTTDGREAFDKAMELVPDLVITDRFMPVIDGPTLCRNLKTTEVTSHIPVIILGPEEKDTGSTDWHQHADDHMHSTFDARDLLMRVHGLIMKRKQHQEEYRKQIKAYPERLSLPENEFLHKILNVLEEQYRDPMFGVEQLTSRVNMTRLQLYRKFKALTNQTPGDFIRKYRLQRAKLLLHREGASVNDVAARTGFINLPAFTKAFKDYTGKSPVEYAETRKNSDEFIAKNEG